MVCVTWLYLRKTDWKKSKEQGENCMNSKRKCISQDGLRKQLILLLGTKTMSILEDIGKQERNNSLASCWIYFERIYH